MNQIIQGLVQEIVRFEITGKKMVSGTLIDVGSDMIVLFNGMDFMYIPLDHIRNFETDRDNENNVQAPTELPSIVAVDNQDELSFEKVLGTSERETSRDFCVRPSIFAWNDHSHYEQLHCLPIPHLQNDVHIPKIISNGSFPSPRAINYMGRNTTSFSPQATNETFASSFDKQVEKYINKFVVLNINERESFIGIINNVEDQIVSFNQQKHPPVYLNMRHIKTFHQV